MGTRKLRVLDLCSGIGAGFPFSNSTDVFTGASPINLISGDNNTEGYSLASIIVALAPSLIGDDYIGRVNVGTFMDQINADTALAGPDAIGDWFGQLAYNVESDTVTVNSIIDSGSSSWGFDITFEFYDLDFVPPGLQITDVNVINAAGARWDQLDDSDISFTADSIIIDAAEIVGAQVSLDQTVTVQITTGPACPGDIDEDFGFAGSDGQVSFGDFLFALTVLGPCP